MKKSKKILAWHFLPDNGHLRYDSKVKVKVGQTLKVDPDKLELCAFGLHASKHAIDALKYAPGALICRVELSGRILSEEDKLCASKRKVLWMADATKTLHLFACDVALAALEAERKAGREPDPRSFAAIEAKHKYLNGKITSEELSAAWSAAESAVESAAESAVESAAWSAAYAAWSAAYAAWSAAESAAYAAWSAAYAARSAAWSAQNKKLTAALMKLKPKKRRGGQ